MAVDVVVHFLRVLTTPVRRRVLAVVAFACLLVLSPTVAQADELRYEAEIVGIDDGDDRAVLELVSRMITLKDHPPASKGALVRRIKRDLESFEGVLRSRGYYDAVIDYRLDTGRAPIRVTFNIDPGERYAVGAFTVELPEGASEAAAEVVHAFDPGLGEERVARSSIIVAAERRLLDALANQAFPFAERTTRSVVVDHATRTVDVLLLVDPGPRVRFGPVAIEGLTDVDQGFVRNRIAWQEGEYYRPALVDKTRRDLRASRLFSSVRVGTQNGVDADGNAAMAVKLREGKFRTIGAGLSFSSSDGFGANTFWEHRNVSRRGERLRLDVGISEIGYSGSAAFRKPDFLRTDQAFFVDASYSVEDNEAFESRKVVTSAGVERSFGPTLSGRAGLAFEYGPVESDARDAADMRLQDETFTLVGVPLEIRNDTSNSVLDPTSGNRFVLSTTPYLEAIGSDLSFTVASLSDAFYVPLTEDARTAVAFRGLVGSVFGAKNSAIPVDKRFYSGGGGSVRGFKYQLAGPLDAELNPIGGRSLIELSGELRWRVSERVGLVPFVDAGNVFVDTLPDVVEPSLLWGAGLGLRYFTAIGPVRLDVATPLNPRGDVDDPFQLYISLGQSY